MQPQSAFASGLCLVLLCLLIGEEKHISAATAEAKAMCPKAALAQALCNLHNKTAMWKKPLPKDKIKNQKLLGNELRAQFMLDCSVQDQLLSFYRNEVFKGLEAGSSPENILNTFDEIKKNLRKCLSCTASPKETQVIKQLKDTFDKIKDRGQQQRRKYKAISELTVLIGWLNTYISHLK